MTYKDPRDQVVDDAAIKALIDAYGERVTSLPPVAIVIAAYNEAATIRGDDRIQCSLYDGLQPGLTGLFPAASDDIGIEESDQNPERDHAQRPVEQGCRKKVSGFRIK